MHFSTSTKQPLLFLVLVLFSTTSLFTPLTFAQTPDSGSLQACTDCLTTAAIAQSSSCTAVPNFSALNLTSASNATEEEKKCICGLTKDSNQVWVRGCIAKPPAACTEQGNATTVMNEVLKSYKSVCPSASNPTTTGPSPGGATGSPPGGATGPSPGKATTTGKSKKNGGTVLSVSSLSSLISVAAVSFVVGVMNLAIL
ncbi:MAG: hypothetical protein J3R72DRAFT_459602 [Linnemannia gamsii]|nr:MAG: hypothetical protein J3R72DRAFT_459602 [Linnemannia gamsii]